MPRRFFSVGERGKILLVPVADVVYLKAELKYITIRTPEREYLLEESLTKLEEEFAPRFVRVHRNCLVARDFVRGCQTPVLVLPDDIPSHPYAVAMETVMLAPKSEVSIYPWKEPPERIPIAVRQVRSFLRSHRPT